jgi:hypothetical protein
VSGVFGDAPWKFVAALIFAGCTGRTVAAMIPPFGYVRFFGYLVAVLKFLINVPSMGWTLL